MNIFLIGYRCTGKTRVGESLAERLGWPFLDTDAEVVRDSGTTISKMVEQNGWAFFRDRESRILKRTCQNEKQVVATGGGIILDPENVSTMSASGWVVWLKARPGTIAERMGRDSRTEAQRPSLTGTTPEAEIEETLTARIPLYTGAMHLSVDTDRRTIDQVTDLILSEWYSLNSDNPNRFLGDDRCPAPSAPSSE